MQTNKLVKCKTLVLMIFSALWIQTALFALEIHEGAVIKINSDRYEMDLTKNGVVSEITVGGETVFSNTGPLVMLPEYQGKSGIMSYDTNSKYVIKKVGSAFKIQFEIVKSLYNKKRKKSVKALKYSISCLASKDKINISYTIKSFKKEKVRFLMASIDMLTEMKGSEVLSDGKLIDRDTFDIPSEKYKFLGTAKNEYAFKPVYLKKYLRDYVKVLPGQESFLQLGRFPHKYSIQIKSKRSEKFELTPENPINLSFTIVMPKNSIDNSKTHSVTIVATDNKPIKKLHKGLFTVGSFRFGDRSSRKVNNFVENKKLVELIKDSGIPALRFNSLYSAFGIEKGWTQRQPFKVDPIYPKDNGPLYLDIADAQFSAIREKLGCEMYFAMGLYNPSWMKKVPGTRWQFQKVAKADADAWGRFAGKLARHAARKNWNIKIWEIWNEADAKNYWEGGTTDEYIDFYRTVVPYIEKADPKVKVSGPVYTGGHFGNGKLMDEFLDGIQGVRCDYINWHHYGSLDLIVPRIKIVQKLLKKYNRKNTGIFISELGVADGVAGDTVKAAVWIARAWKRILYSDVDYCVLWALSGLSGERGIINFKTFKPTPVYYLFKMFNKNARLYESALITPPKMPEGMEAIAAKTPEGYAFFLIKNNKINRFEVKFDYSKLGAKNVELYAVREGKSAQKVSPVTEGDGFFKYTFNGFEILCVKVTQ